MCILLDGTLALFLPLLDLFQWTSALPDVRRVSIEMPFAVLSCSREHCKSHLVEFVVATVGAVAFALSAATVSWHASLSYTQLELVTT